MSCHLDDFIINTNLFRWLYLSPHPFRSLSLYYQININRLNKKYIEMLHAHMQDQHHPLWRTIAPLLPALLSTQRASWEQGVAAQSLLELYLALFPSSSSSSSSPNLANSDSDSGTGASAAEGTEPPLLLSYIYNLAHDALVRASTGPDGRLAVRINNGEDASALDPACVGEAVLFVRDRCYGYFYGDGDGDHDRLLGGGATGDDDDDDDGETREKIRWRTGPERMLRFLLWDAVRVPPSPSLEPSTAPATSDTEKLPAGAGAISHLFRSPEIWSDGGYMGPPFLAAAAVSRSCTRSLGLGAKTKTDDGNVNDNVESMDVDLNISPSALLDAAFDQILLYARFLRRPSRSGSRPVPGSAPASATGPGPGPGSEAEAAGEAETGGILLAHIYDGARGDFAPVDASSGRYGSAAWGVGMGWFVNGIVRVMRTVERALASLSLGLHSGNRSVQHLRWLEQWVETDDREEEEEDGGRGPHRIQRSWSLLVSLLDGILPHQRPRDGLFHNVVDDATTFVETNLAQMLAAAIFRLCALYHYYRCEDAGRPSVTRALGRVLDRERIEAYEAAAERMYVAARAKRDRWGLVQGVCGSPGFKGPGTAAEGQAWAVLMEVARWEWHRVRKRTDDGCK